MQERLTATYTQATQMSGKSVWTLKRWAKQGKLQTTRDIHGKELLVVASLRQALGLAPSEGVAAST